MRFRENQWISLNHPLWQDQRMSSMCRQIFQTYRTSYLWLPEYLFRLHFLQYKPQAVQW
nr:MAG TPA: hypothetical protein [Caudoviricetes sp.]